MNCWFAGIFHFWRYPQLACPNALRRVVLVGPKASAARSRETVDKWKANGTTVYCKGLGPDQARLPLKVRDALGERRPFD